MSRQSDIYVDGPTWTITRFRSWPIQKPVAKQSLDFPIARFGMTPPEILAHQLEPRVEQIERHAKRVGD
jgi:hypothetical protein